MDEEKPKEEIKKTEESSPKDDGEGIQSKTVSELDRADEIVERRNRVCEREEKILARKESFEARRMIGGSAEAGQTPNVKTEDEKKKAGAKEFFKGTQLEKDIDKL